MSCLKSTSKNSVNFAASDTRTKRLRRYVPRHTRAWAQKMTRQRQPGFFDIAERTTKLAQMGILLVGLNNQIDWEAFRPDLSRVHEKERKSNVGARPIDVVLMFKLLALQQLHNLSDASNRIPDTG
jgi:hypothetical protein